jgi:hypothetical protein
VSAKAFARWRLALTLAIPSLGGLAYLTAFEAPMRLIAINAGALVVAMVWVMLGPMPEGQRARHTFAGGAAMALFLPLLTGPVVGGVARWLPSGPVILHSGALLLPLIVVLAARGARLGPALLAIATAALALQPDAAMLAGLAAASVVLAAIHRSRAFALVAASAAALALVTFNAGTLEPQIFTEGVLAQVAARSWLAAAALAIVLFGVPLLLLPVHDETRPLVSLLVVLGAVAVIAPFPFPLIGYGASSILGFGLALGAIARPTQESSSFRAAA